MTRAVTIGVIQPDGTTTASERNHPLLTQRQALLSKDRSFQVPKEPTLSRVKVNAEQSHSEDDVPGQMTQKF